MKNIGKWLVMLVFAAAFVLAAKKTAHAEDDCLEIGWFDQAGNWSWYKAWVDAYEEHHRVHIKYDYHHGELELKAVEGDSGDPNQIVLRGKWFEGSDENRHEGLVYLTMEKGHHHAKGWYTSGMDESQKHFDMALRDCKR